MFKLTITDAAGKTLTATIQADTLFGIMTAIFPAQEDAPVLIEEPVLERGPAVAVKPLKDTVEVAPRKYTKRKPGEKTDEMAEGNVDAMLEDLIVNEKKPSHVSQEYGIPVIKIYNLKSNFKRDNPEKYAAFEAKRDGKAGSLRDKVLRSFKGGITDPAMIAQAAKVSQKEVEEQIAWLKHDKQI